MASNNYNPYNYSYEQSSAPQYSAYQTAPASNNASQSSRQYQPTPPPPTTQSTNYMSYPAQSYGTQRNGYISGQDNSWNGSTYGATRETTSRAAEVLHNMSNTSYAPSTTSSNQPGFTATNAATSHSRYSTGPSHSPQVQTHPTQSSYGQLQARPHSVNTNSTQGTASRGLPLPAAQMGYSSQGTQQQRSASPAQPQYSHSATSSARSAAMNAVASQQYTDYNQRQLPNAESSRTNQSSTTSNSYNYADAQTISPPTASISPAPTPSVSEPYNGQSTTTVDPMAVYDPWPEYQRKQAALRAQKAAEDAARAEEERIAEEARKAEEEKQEEERKRQEEEEGKARQSAIAASQPKQRKKAQRQQSNVVEASPAAAGTSDEPNELEAQIRAMMAKMRELNGKDPALLARIWEEERRAKAPAKSPTVQTKPTPQPATAQPVQAAQVSAPQVVSQRNKAASRELAAASVVKPAAPISAQPLPARPQAQANTRGGNTIWPPERKTSLATAAATYLSGLNSNHPIDAPQILSILDSNPSYIELCEQLEQRGLKLDRAAFAKTLLTAVPDVNSASRKAAPQPASLVNGVQKAPVPAAVMKKDLVAANLHHTPAAASPAPRVSYPPSPGNVSVMESPAPVAEMVPIRADLKPPANKEEAARKRNLSDLVDLTMLSDEEDLGPPQKRLNVGSTYQSTYPQIQDAMNVDEQPAVNNFPTASVPSRPALEPTTHAVKLPPNDLGHRSVVQVLDKRKALRRNTYNPATIARDVLLACGRFPGERQLNQHLDVMRQHIPQITNDSDLSTIRWDLIDPGSPPPGYFVNSVQALTEDADDEEDSENEDGQARPRSRSHTIGGESGARAQALPQAINPFTKQKRRGRPPRQSLPTPTLPKTPNRPSDPTTMSASASRAAGVGYSAFRSVELGEDGKPVPKKKGRPVGWRKAIHGSAAAQAQPAANGHTGPVQHQPSQPSGLRNVRTDGANEPIRIDSRSPSVANRNPQYQSYKCKWQKCNVELHNLETLQKHVYKVHRKETLRNTLECLWSNCGSEVTRHDPTTSSITERHAPLAFDNEDRWREHIQRTHIDPLSWELGDGPASGLSGRKALRPDRSDAEILTG
ncbi:hypothetical protein P153DRAFT_364956 [Dothidotthia symphoricarpi CBS 119687]|uniref:C2H2-type domain-containing protein n=1 Tax=Dothidotthia symphoricarpi CBS 119687 TaxID=1392245 RepID=A0A6A6AKC3_9PLEO|nr:uncharacterized protein P153DRAFT_364956 [Dothidotthia symphoricarpi CBS 119687]KAF2131364.1 hypothetical protein P153DRAFT_364956 [Dothidotthia symphoricarpi CBS 119687]